MGKIKHQGLATGTSGSGQITLENTIASSMNSAIKKDLEFEMQNKDRMAEILIDAGVKKFNKEDLLFVTKDSTGMLIFLEKGNDRAGLEHIINGNNAQKNDNGHLEDFVKLHNIDPRDIKAHIYNIITNGKLLCSINKERGYDRVYSYKDNYFILSGIGKNGYIVTCIPITKKRALKIKEDNVNGKK